MEVVTISSQAYDSYVTIGEADLYLAASTHAANWTTATDTVKAQALVTATRILDRQQWAVAYDTQAERESVQDIQDACIEMALALVDGSDLQTAQSTAQKLQKIEAGEVSLTYFRGAEGTPTRFPTIVHELLRAYLAGSSAVVQGKATGVGGTSSTDDDFGHSGPV